MRPELMTVAEALLALEVEVLSLDHIGAALGAMRALLAPEGPQEKFDLGIARVWLREQRRQGYRVSIAGVALAS